MLVAAGFSLRSGSRRLQPAVIPWRGLKNSIETVLMRFERKHRLPREQYRGRIAASFTACLCFSAGAAVDDEVAGVICYKLREASDKHHVDAAAWCLMPDHLHAVLVGRSEVADVWKAMSTFKQQTGFWLASDRPNMEWQKDFFRPHHSVG